MIEDRGSKIEDRRSRIAPSPVKRFSILDPRSSILDHLRYPDLSLPPVVVFVATDFAARVVKLAVEPRFLSSCDDAVGLGLGLVSLNLRFVPFYLCGFAARKRSVFQPVGDAVLLVLLASVNAWRIPAVATDFAARVVSSRLSRARSRGVTTPSALALASSR